MPHKIYVCFFSLLLLFNLSNSADAASKIQSMDLNSDAAHAILQIGFTHKPHDKLILLHSPLRINLEFSHSQLEVELPAVDKTNPYIKKFFSSHTKSGALRLTIDLKKTVDYKTRWFKTRNKHRVIYELILHSKNLSSKKIVAKKTLAPDQVNLATTAPTTNPVNANIANTTATPSSTKVQPVITAQQHQKLQYLIVVIDPGHGGKDPGARGMRGNQEKNVVLTIAQYLKQNLMQVPGIKVYMTRDSDYFIPLRGRLDLARQYKADIFVSMHADAFINREAHGASVFALSERGATSESARWLAEKENESEMLGGADLNNKNYLLKSVLIDMSQTATINSSLDLGSQVLGRLKAFTDLHSHKVGQAAFVVLKSPDIPSILVENGFISNPREENNLTNGSYQKALAKQISDGIISYFKAKMPPNTIFSAQYGKR